MQGFSIPEDKKLDELFIKNLKKEMAYKFIFEFENNKKVQESKVHRLKDHINEQIDYIIKIHNKKQKS